MTTGKTTLVFLVTDTQILLAMKKRGFGIGKWNGVGGKVHAGESTAEAAVREAKEEVGVNIASSALKKMAELSFVFIEDASWNQETTVFVVRDWQGIIAESEEMRPEWFSSTDIPYDHMWVDDPLWLPRVLAGEQIRAEFHFAARGEECVFSQVQSVLEF